VSKEAQMVIPQQIPRALRKGSLPHKFLQIIKAVMQADHFLLLNQHLKLKAIRKENRRLLQKRKLNHKLSQMKVLKMKIQ
jgi:hypothetical protein